jgi:hypothetical protein
MFVKITNGNVAKFPYSLGELRRDNPQISFPRKIPDAILAEYGVYRVAEAEAPKVDNKAQRVVQEVKNVDGVWTQQWRIQNLPDEQASENVRAHRDRLLAETDWVVVMHTEKGTNIPLEWEVYRQSLRDITNQTGFPHAVDWPTKP